MTELLKYRLTGAIIIISLVIIVLPLMFDGAGYKELAQKSPSGDKVPPISFDQNFPELKKKVIVRHGLPNAAKDADRGAVRSLIQAGTFVDADRAAALVKTLQDKGYEEVKRRKSADGQHIVYLGPFVTPKAEALAQQIQTELKLKVLVKDAR